MKTELTKTKILEHPLPEPGKLAWIYDQRQGGLCVCITPAGARTFYVYTRVPGYKSPQRIKLGTVADLGHDLGAVRKLAALKLLEIAGGKDVVAEKKAKVAAARAEKNQTAEGPTLKTVWLHYLETYAKVHKRPSSIKEDERMWKAYLAPWQDRPLTDITFGEVNRLKVQVAGIDEESDTDDEEEEKGPSYYMANRVLALLSKMFTEAAKGGIATANPVSGVERFNEQTRNRYLEAGELKALFSALKEEEQDVQDFIQLALATGARRGMLRTMEWSEVNLTFKTWTVPAPKMKGDKAHTIPLVPQAVTILERRKLAAEKMAKGRERGRWVFPGDGPTGHLMSVKKSFHALLKRADISGVRLHDLRRTVATWMLSTGANDIIIAQLLAHTYKSVTGIYARLTPDTVRKALEKAVPEMWAAGASMTAKQAG